MIIHSDFNSEAYTQETVDVETLVRVFWIIPELTLLNNNIQTVSGAISAGSSCTSLSPYTVYSQTLGNFVEGLTCYFATDGYGNAFKNPYDAAGGNQIVYDLAAASVKKGQVNIRHFPAADTTINGAVIPSGGLFASGLIQYGFTYFNKYKCSRIV